MSLVYKSQPHLWAGRLENLLPATQATVFTEVFPSHPVSIKKYSYPFSHLVIDNFLPPSSYDALVSLYQAALGCGQEEKSHKSLFSRFEWYDLYAFMPKPTLELPLGFFFLESYFRMLEKYLGISLSRDTYLCYHHHKPSARDNYIHSDWIWGHFADDPLPNGANAWYRQCEHHQPLTLKEELVKESKQTRGMIRAATAIYYLNNEVWDESLGGETAVFARKRPDTFVRKVAPINNRLFAFEITPYSFHNFMKNNAQSRNSIAQWFFASPSDSMARFGEIPTDQSFGKKP